MNKKNEIRVDWECALCKKRYLNYLSFIKHKESSKCKRVSLDTKEENEK